MEKLRASWLLLLLHKARQQSGLPEPKQQWICCPPKPVELPPVIPQGHHCCSPLSKVSWFLNAYLWGVSLGRQCWQGALGGCLCCTACNLLKCSTSCGWLGRGPLRGRHLGSSQVSGRATLVSLCTLPHVLLSHSQMCQFCHQLNKHDQLCIHSPKTGKTFLKINTSLNL